MSQVLQRDKKEYKKNNGYIALLTVLILSVAVVAVIIAVSIASLITSQITISNSKNYQSNNAVESCSEEALVSLSFNETLESGDIILPEYTCTIDVINSNIIDDITTEWEFNVSSDQDGYMSIVNIVLERSDTIYITSWEEIN